MNGLIRNLVLAGFVFSLVSLHASAAVRHPFQKKRQFERDVENSRNIEIYEVGNLPTRKYEEIRYVQVQGIFKKKLDGIYEKLRVKAYKSKGDAVVGLECPRLGKNIGVTCYGYIVKWVN